MLIRHFFLYFLIFGFGFLLSPDFIPSSFASTDQIEVLKRKMKQMEKNMEIMNKKIAELEEQNSLLEQLKDTQEFPIAKEIQPEGQTFLSRTFQSLNPDISVTGIFAGSWYSEDSPEGLAEVDPADTGINLQEIELGFQSVVDPYFRFDNFISFGEHIELEEAYATTLGSLPINSQFRIGIMRSKFGRINLLHRHNQNFTTLPLPVAEFLGEHFNPPSIEANFLVPLPWHTELSASVGIPDVETSSFAKDEDTNNLGRLLYNLHLSNFFEIGESLGISIGRSFATGPNNTEPGKGNRTNLYGADIFIKYKPTRSNLYRELNLQSEFIYRDAETDEGKRKDWGLYAQLVYRFAKRWNIGGRYELTNTDDPIMMAMTQEPDDHEAEPDDHEAELDDHEGESHVHEGELGLLGKQQRISSMLTFNPTEFSKIRLEYNYLNRDFDENRHGIFLQFQHTIGAHAAHPY